MRVAWIDSGSEIHDRKKKKKMGNAIAEGVRVKVTGISSTEHGAEGIVKAIRPGWAGREAVVVTPGVLRPREFTVPLADLSRS